MNQPTTTPFPAVPLEVRNTVRPQPLPPCPYLFPDARKAPAHGLLASGGDFRPETIIAAYRAGAFPWPQSREEFLWFSPHPRAVIPLDGLHVSRRLARTIRQGRFRVTVDAAFDRVIAACSVRREEGTWITPRLRRGYNELHVLGYAHSFETWTDEGELAGGIYGIGLGAMFGAESMFHRVTDASKVAMAGMVQHLNHIGVELLDVQVLNAHTESMGAREISRDEYLWRLGGALQRTADWVAAASVVRQNGE